MFSNNRNFLLHSHNVVVKFGKLNIDTILPNHSHILMLPIVVLSDASTRLNSGNASQSGYCITAVTSFQGHLIRKQVTCNQVLLVMFILITESMLCLLSSLISSYFSPCIKQAVGRYFSLQFLCRISSLDSVSIDICQISLYYDCCKMVIFSLYLFLLIYQSIF